MKACRKHLLNSSAISLALLSSFSIYANSLPVANPDSVTVNEDSYISFDPVQNDTDPDGDTIFLHSVVTLPNHGYGGKHGPLVKYQPNPNFCGTDSLEYYVSDGSPNPSKGLVSITVNCVNDKPQGADDSMTVTEDSMASIDPVLNDTDIDGDTLTLHSVKTQPSFGTAGKYGNVVKYWPNPNFCGSDSFEYYVTDGNPNPGSARVYVSVTCVNDTPQAFNNNLSLVEDNIATINPIIDDTDADGDSLFLQGIKTYPVSGTVTFNSNTIEYRPNQNFCGSDSLEYYVSDGQSVASARIDVSVQCVNELPVAVDDHITVYEDSYTLANLTANDIDVDGDALYVHSIKRQGYHGVAKREGNLVRYQPDHDFCGTDSFEYYTNDYTSGLDDALVTVTVTCINEIPVAVDNTIDVIKGSFVSFSPLINDYDTDIGETLEMIGIEQPPTNGNATLSGDILTYTPNPLYCGNDSLVYRMSDSNGYNNLATVTFNIDCTEPVTLSCPSGTADCSANLTTAINDAINLSRPLHIPATTVHLPNTFTYDLAGNSLRIVGVSTNHSVFNARSINIQNAGTLEVKNIKIDGDLYNNLDANGNWDYVNKDSNLLYVSNAQRLDIGYSIFVNAGLTGVLLNNASAFDFHHNTVKNMGLSQTTLETGAYGDVRQGTGFVTTNSRNGFVYDNTIEDIFQIGLLIAQNLSGASQCGDSSNILVLKNRVIGALDNGIRVERQDSCVDSGVLVNHVTVKDNTVINTEDSGIRLNGLNLSAVGNHIYADPSRTFKFCNTTARNVAQCTTESFANTRGIKSDGLQSTALLGNQIFTAPYKPDYLADYSLHNSLAGYSVIAGNKIEGMVHGITLQASFADVENNTIVWNTVKNIGHTGIRVIPNPASREKTTWGDGGVPYPKAVNNNYIGRNTIEAAVLGVEVSGRLSLPKEPGYPETGDTPIFAYNNTVQDNVIKQTDTNDNSYAPLVVKRVDNVDLLGNCVENESVSGVVQVYKGLNVDIKNNTFYNRYRQPAETMPWSGVYLMDVPENNQQCSDVLVQKNTFFNISSEFYFHNSDTKVSCVGSENPVIRQAQVAGCPTVRALHLVE